MWCPSVSLSVWANAWLAGQAAPDDVLDALSQWAPKHSVTAYDSVAADCTGLPWPDVRGLPAGTTFQRDAITAGEALIIVPERGSPIGLVPEFLYEDPEDDDPDFDLSPELCGLSWTVYSLSQAPVPEYVDLGEAEYALRSAVRSAADALTALRAGGSGIDVDDPRGMVEQVLEAGRLHQAPVHSPERALRVLENAAHVDAIITVSAGLMPIGHQSSSEAQIATDALRPLSGVVRSARLAAVSAIVHSAWQR